MRETQTQEEEEEDDVEEHESREEQEKKENMDWGRGREETYKGGERRERKWGDLRKEFDLV